MSTILDALRKLQRDRERSRTPGDLRRSVTEDFSFYPVRRRRIPWVVLAISLAVVAGVFVAYPRVWRAQPRTLAGLESAAPEPAPKRSAATKQARKQAVRVAPGRPATVVEASPASAAVGPQSRRPAPRAAAHPVGVAKPVAKVKPTPPRPSHHAKAASELLVPGVPPIPASPTPHFARVTRAPVHPTPGAQTLEIEKEFAQGTMKSESAPARSPAKPSGSIHTASSKPPPGPQVRPEIEPDSVKKPTRPVKPPPVMAGSASEAQAEKNPFLDPFEPLTRLQRMPREKAAATVGVREESRPAPAIRANPEAAEAAEDSASRSSEEAAEHPSGFPALVLLEVRWHPDPRRRRARIDLDGGRNLEVKEGDQIGGARIVRIDPGVVEIEFRDARERLHLSQ